MKNKLLTLLFTIILFFVEGADFSSWNEITTKVGSFSVTTLIPNYEGTIFKEGHYCICGHTNEGGYVTSIPVAHFFPPSSLKEFVKGIQKLNPNYTVSPISPPKKMGAKYVCDLSPKTNDPQLFHFRILATKNRIVKMVTSDPNQENRTYFFDNIRLKN